MNRVFPPWFAFLLVAILSITLHRPAAASDDWSAVQPGHVVLFRHALAPGGGDPPGFVLNDCSTQRNLSEAGRGQAQRMGQAFEQRKIAVGGVWSSQWCRTRDTADLAFPGRRVDQPAFNSFFGNSGLGPEQTQTARQLLEAWRGEGVLVVVTHQVNITALTGIVPSSGEGVIVKRTPQGLEVVGRIAP